MPKFKLGETSRSVNEKKIAITNSIIQKTSLIKKIKNYSDIPISLPVKGKTISIASVHRWSDPDLNIISYARNSAHAAHNEVALRDLLKAVASANSSLAKKKNKSESNQSRKRVSDVSIDELENENKQLRLAIAEVYRAYMQVLGRFREDKAIDESFRKLLLDQSRVLGKNKIWEVK